MSDVYIIGTGIHPFGRTDGRSGREQGVYAVREALADAGLEWEDIECAYGGSAAGGSADIMVNELGLTGLPFTNVANGCATGGSSIASARNAIAAGAYDLALAVGFDKHPRGAFNARPTDYGLPEWYGQTGMMLTTQFFALKIQRYMQLYRISRTTLGRVAEKAFRNAEKTPHAWRRSRIDLETILNAPMINDPLTKYMFCSPSEGGVALILASEKKMRELVPTASGSPIFPWRPARRTPSKFSSRESASKREANRPSWPRKQPLNRPALALRISMLRNCRTPNQEPRSCIWPKTASAQMAIRSSGLPRDGPKSLVPCRSIPMAAALPAANRSALPDCVKSMKMWINCAGDAANGKCPMSPRPHIVTFTVHQVFRLSQFSNDRGDYGANGRQGSAHHRRC